MTSMTFSEQMLHCTVRIEGAVGDKKNIGTGFLFAHDNEIYLVTNKHVVKPGFKGNAVFLASKFHQGDYPDYGHTVNLPITWDDFIGHPNNQVDVTVAKITQFMYDNNPFTFSFDIDYVPNRFDHNYILPQDEVYFVGYPKGIWDEKNCMPVTRKGIMATSYDLNYKGTPSFLIDGAVFEGSSGSPVFVFKRPPSTGRNLHPISDEKLFLMGILAAYESTIDGVVQVDGRNDIELKTYLNLGKVFQASTILESINALIKRESEELEEV